jgi:anaerobic selenocysteine-containing dehydrogenase
MHKGDNGWEAARAIACLPALTGQLGVPGSGFGPRHGGGPHGRALNSIVPPRRTPHGPVLPNQMAAITEALHDGRIANLLLMGTNMLSSFADANAVAAGLARARLVVAYDLFLSATAERCADVVLPATAWLEELGAKMSSTHVYLMERALEPAGETRSVSTVLRDLAQRLAVADFFPWADDAALLDAVLDHPSTGHATVASLRARGGMAPLAISPVAHPTHRYDTPSGKVEFVSQRAAALGLPVLPSPQSIAPPRHDARHPLVLTQGRTLNHFHSFYNSGSVLPTLAKRERTPQLWIAPADATARGITDGASIRVFNARGTLAARAHVTERVPPGTLWMRDGWPGLNQLTDGARVLPDHAVDAFAFSAGQARFEARVDVARVDPTSTAADHGGSHTV